MLNIMQIQEILPHRYPFLLIDRVDECVSNSHIKAYKNITINEQVFQGHFPDHPIYPGVMIIEGMAQAGGVLAFQSLNETDSSLSKEELQNKVVYFMSIDRAKFRNPVTPGDKLEYEIKAIKNKGAIWVFEAKAFVNQSIVAEAELKAMIRDK
jgi:3-hydroxyacyl-[acyl-carrier-protein] dehydratase